MMSRDVTSHPASAKARPTLPVPLKSSRRRGICLYGGRRRDIRRRPPAPLGRLAVEAPQTGFERRIVEENDAETLAFEGFDPMFFVAIKGDSHARLRKTAPVVETQGSALELS